MGSRYSGAAIRVLVTSFRSGFASGRKLGSEREWNTAICNGHFLPLSEESGREKRPYLICASAMWSSRETDLQANDCYFAR
jgi:hypothetical protein